MAHPSTLYRFRIDLSDVDRGVYESLDFRAAMHPSETPDFLLTRVLAYALNFQEGIEFAPGGLSDTDGPAIRALNLTGGLKLWIEVGNPSARKLHKGSKAAPEVKVYTYKDPTPLMRELSAADIHRSGQIAIFSVAPKFLNELILCLERDNSWSLIQTEGSVTLSVGAATLQTEFTRHTL